ncbi:putative serine/threonine-protein kinase isoform X1 [Vespula maculifrons]|uniref:Serine/threonine-protein kinase isoform X1 n=1 Tax=Vespula maculifrons TaxID=7453 RepID=A0ABD2C069_VESMC
MSTNRLRSPSATNKWSTKIGENTRKNSLRASSTLDTGWSQDLQSHPLRSTASNIYQPNTCSSEHDLKRSEEKTSEETILIEVDGNVDDYLTSPDMKNLSIKQKNDAFLRRNHRYMYDYPNLNVSQAMLAMRKLQKLKELQRRRDLTEKYYSHEIRKLIGDYFGTNPRTELSSLKYNNNNMINNNNNNNNNRIQNSNFLQPYLGGDRIKDDLKSLEPCGTMTTITRLDCGCIQETTRPIFTTTTGRVQKKTCNQSQDQVLLKLTSTNPQEHLCSSIDPNKLEQYSQKSKKKRVGIESRNYELNSIDVDREIGKEHDLRNPGNVQALRKYSDTSTTSI